MIRPEPGLEFIPGLVLVRPLGQGGMGEAWIARDLGRDEELVAKILPASAPEDRVALLRREARLVRKLDHPRIVPVYGFEQGPGGSAVLLRYMRGGDASGLRSASPGKVVALARDVAEALAYLHGRGVVHRDVKASNVLLDDDGRAHLADFGIAAVAGPGEDEEVVLGGGSRGSMSPQQERGEPPEPADDVYGLGALLYELLSGRPVPVPTASDGAEGGAAPSLEPAVGPRALRELVGAMLAPAAEDRPGTHDVLRALGAIETPLDAPPVSDRPPVRLQPPPRVRDIEVFPSRAGADRPVSSSRPPRARLLQAVLLSALALGAVFVVLVLPHLVSTGRGSEPVTEAPEPGPTAEPRTPSSSLPAEAQPATPETTPLERPPVVAESSESSPPSPEPRNVEPPRGPGRGEEGRSVAADDAARVEFERAMSEAQAGLDAGNLDAARAAIDRAASVRPADAAVADARRRLDDAERTEALERHREAAAAREAREDWPGAVAEYEAALKVDPTVAFALDGRGRAQRRARLAQELVFHASHGERLATESVAREAEGVLADAREIASPGPRLREQVAALERALTRARTPVAVELQSDGITQVVVHRYGTLGAFKEKSLQLRPGTYVVVGTRRGFRDVRRTLVVDPDAPPAPLVVRCEESI